MFTGIVQGLGRVRAVFRPGAGARLTVAGGRILRGVRRGESVAVSGVCLTAVAVRGRDDPAVSFDLVPETLSRTTLGVLRAGDRVNLERSLRWGDSLGGHLVSGHVEGVGIVREVRAPAPGDASSGREVTIEAPAALARRLRQKGSVAVDGVSLTIASRRGRRFRVALIPETLRRTTLGRVQAGDHVNLETERTKVG